MPPLSTSTSQASLVSSGLGPTYELYAFPIFPSLRLSCLVGYSWHSLESSISLVKGSPSRRGTMEHLWKWSGDASRTNYGSRLLLYEGPTPCCHVMVSANFEIFSRQIGFWPLGVECGCRTLSPGALLLDSGLATSTLESLTLIDGMSAYLR